MTINTLHPDVLKGVIDDTIRDALAHQPRSLQKRIGPSEIGEPCDRWVIHKLAGMEEPARPALPWKPFIGTAVHAQMEEIFTNARTSPGAPDWVTEHEVTVGYLPDGTAITGHSDLFHISSGTVIDWKIVGERQLANYKTNGPSERYRRQAHSYGGGFMLDPQPWGTPKQVAIYFLPRDREFERGYLWAEPWDPHVWSETIARVNRLWTLLQREGTGCTDTMPCCDNRFCHWCRLAERSAQTGQSLWENLPPL